MIRQGLSKSHLLRNVATIYIGQKTLGNSKTSQITNDRSLVYKFSFELKQYLRACAQVPHVLHACTFALNESSAKVFDLSSH